MPNLLKITDWRLPPTRFRILDEDDPTTILEEYLSTFTYGGRTYELPSELDLDMIFASAALNPRPGQVNPNICFSDRVENGQRMCFFALGTYKLAEKTADLTCSAVDMQGLYCPVLNLLPSDRIAPLPHLPAPGGTFEIPGDDPEPVSEVKSALPTPNMVTATAPGFTTPYLVATIIPTGP